MAECENQSAQPCCKGTASCCPDSQQLQAKFRRLHELHRHHHGHFLRHYKYFRYFRPAAALFTLIILYLLFSWVGFKEIGLFCAALLIIKEIFQFVFLLRLEKRILKPMEKLRQGLEEVTNGNYSAKVEYDQPNDLSLVIDSFNVMTEKLSAGEKMQAEYEENRKALIANISHDLKTPITAIQGYIEALLEGASQSAGPKYLKKIHYNIVYVNKLIDDLFLFSKLDMQKLSLQCEPVPIRAFMDDLMEEYKFDLGERNIEFQYLVELENEARVNLDGKRFVQAFGNLINNAIQHGPETNLSLRVKLYRQDASLCVDVKDNGPGIPADKLPFIFDQFYRIDTSRPKDYASTGLGLAIAKELVEAHGGKITVASTTGQGACFTIMLPVLPETGEDCR